MAQPKKTTNERLMDAALVRLINLQRYANSEVRQMIGLLNSVDVKLFEKLTAALLKLPVESFTVRRLDALLSGVWSLNESIYRQLATRSGEEMRALTELEINSQAKLFSDILPEGQIRVGVPSVDQVWAATKARPLQGRTMGEWFSTLGKGRQQRISDSLRSGYVAGKTIDEMITDLRGTKAGGYEDGLLQIDRRNAESVVRTATSATAQQARNAFYGRNSDLFSSEQWLSTLDNRTSETCMIRDGLHYTIDDHEPVGHKIPWGEGPGEIHWNCRSTSIPVLNSAETLGLDLPPVERAAMGGVAAPGTNFKDWITRQPAKIQDDLLGGTRGALLRAGKIEFTKFFNDKGRLLTLAELAER